MMTDVCLLFHSVRAPFISLPSCVPAYMLPYTQSRGTGLHICMHVLSYGRYQIISHAFPGASADKLRLNAAKSLLLVRYARSKQAWQVISKL